MELLRNIFEERYVYMKSIQKQSVFAHADLLVEKILVKSRSLDHIVYNLQNCITFY